VRLFVGDIQDKMIDGKTSRENPSWPHKEIYPMPFDLTSEKGTLLLQCYVQAEWLKIPFVQSPLPTCQSLNTQKE
jgi:hypothetical protein